MMSLPEPVKCLVWDLDGTVWQGTLLESDACRLRPGVRGVIAELDRRGLLQSVASRNDPDLALPLLGRKRLARYFVEPQVGWDSKVRSLQTLSRTLDVPFDALALIDDEPFEREQVEKLLPGVRTYRADHAVGLPGFKEFLPDVTSAESRSRRATYQGMAARTRVGLEAGMSQSEFLEWCRTELTLRTAEGDDLPRILELLGRTHQLNATGQIWPGAAVGAWIDDPEWRVFVAHLQDRFVDYGRIGVAACHARRDEWEIVVFLLSCRVLSRGISGFFLSWVRGRAATDGASRILARYKPGTRNVQMRALYRLSGLSPVREEPGGMHVYAGPARPSAEPPRWLKVHEEVN